MDAPAILPIYLLVKYILYSSWCYRGVKRLRPSQEKRVASAMMYGLTRLPFGFGFGILIYLGGSLVMGAVFDLPLSGVITYLIVYVPVRWIEWSIIGAMISSSGGFVRDLIRPSSLEQLRWRAGGIVVSFIADIPMIIVFDGMLPVGRFMC